MNKTLICTNALPSEVLANIVFPFALSVFKINCKHELLKGYTINVTLYEEHLEDSGQLSLKQLSSIKSSSFLIWGGIQFPRDFKRSRVKLVALLLNLELPITSNVMFVFQEENISIKIMKEFIFTSVEEVYKWSIFICHRELIFMFLFNGRWIY